MDKKTILLKTGTAGLFKALSAIASFVMAIAITKLLTSDNAGLFFLAITLLSASATFFRLGLDSVILRKLSSSDNPSSVTALNTGIVWVLAACIPVLLLTLTFHQKIAEIIFSKPEFGVVLQNISWSLPALAICTLFAMGFQSQHRVILTTLFQNLGVSVIFIIGFIALFVFYPNSLTAGNASFVYSSSALFMLLLAILVWNKCISGNWGQLAFKDPGLWSASSNLWVSTTMSLIVQWSGILIAGAFVEAKDIAYLSTAQKTAALTSFVLMIVNMVVAPRYARLWKQNNLTELESLAKWSTRAMLLMAVPVVAAMIFFPDSIMRLFGPQYENGALFLIIFAVGQFVNVATGSVGYLLNMSGHERDFRRVTMFSGPLTIGLSYILVIEYGAIGAAIGTSVGMAAQNIGALYMVRKRLGFWPLS